MVFQKIAGCFTTEISRCSMQITLEKGPVGPPLVVKDDFGTVILSILCRDLNEDGVTS